MTRFSARRSLAAAGVLSLAALAGLPRLAPADSDTEPATTKEKAKATIKALVDDVKSTIEAKSAPETKPSADAKSADAKAADTKPASKPATGPAAVKVTKGDLTLEVRAEGAFQPVDPFEVKPTFKVYAGPLVVASLVQPGAMVRKDQPLISFDRTWIDWQLIGSEHEVNVAKASQAKAETDAKLAVASEQLALRQAEDAVKNVEAGRKWFEEVDGPQMLLMADLNVKQSQNSLDDQTDELDQLRKMYQGEELTAATADIVVRRAIRSAEQAKVLLKVQQERRDKTKGFDYPVRRQMTLDVVEQARTSLASLKAQQEQTAVVRAAGLQAAKVAVEQATKKQADLREDAAQFQIKAPTDGVAAYGNLTEAGWTGGDPKVFKVGEKTAAGQVLMRVYQPGKLRLVLNLPESQAFWVEQGDKARVTPAAMPQTGYEAKTAAVEVLSKGPAGMAFATTIDLDNVDARLIPGMKASVVIEAAKVKDALLLPLPLAAGGKVQVKDKDGAVAEKTVKLGRTDGQQVEILSGLSEGDEVVKK